MGAFLVGLWLSSQLIAALYGIVDCRYAWRREYPRVMRRLLFWSVLGGVALLGLGSRFRSGCGWGLVSFALIHAGLFGLMKLSAARAIRRRNGDSSQSF